MTMRHTTTKVATMSATTMVRAAVLAGVLAVAASGCATTSQESSQPPKAQANAASAAVGQVSTGTVVQPENQGAALLDAINSATRSIDIVIYQIGNQSIQDALLAAMRDRNVTVRVVMDGSTASQVTKNGGFAAAMKAAVAQAGLPATQFSAHWASDNFNITHQKSVMIDAVDAQGAPLAAGAMPSTAVLLVSTGNFYSYKDDPFYSARDFYVTSADQSLINAASTVFVSDFGCAGPTVTNGLSAATNLVWSNGTTGLYPGQVGQYPPVTQGYFGDGKATDPEPVDAGNSFPFQYNLVANAGAGDVVRIYNEELSSSNFVTAIEGALDRGADVRIVMTYNQPSKGVPNSSMVNLEALAAHVPSSSSLPGATVTLYAPQQVVPEALYIHAKAITVNGSDGAFKGGFVGSVNLSNPSMLDNRELGLPLTAATAETNGVIISTFDADFASTANTTQLTKANPSNVPATWNGTGVAGAVDESKFADENTRVGSPAGRCGPVA